MTTNHCPMTTISDLAHQRGQRVFDTALPQAWTDKVYEATGTWPFGFVWSYDPTDSDKSQIWGHPVPITEDAKAHFERIPANLR